MSSARSISNSVLSFNQKGLQFLPNFSHSGLGPLIFWVSEWYWPEKWAVRKQQRKKNFPRAPPEARKSQAKTSFHRPRREKSALQVHNNAQTSRTESQQSEGLSREPFDQGPYISRCSREHWRGSRPEGSLVMRLAINKKRGPWMKRRPTEFWRTKAEQLCFLGAEKNGGKQTFTEDFFFSEQNRRSGSNKEVRTIYSNVKEIVIGQSISHFRGTQIQ